MIHYWPVNVFRLRLCSNMKFDLMMWIQVTSVSVFMSKHENSLYRQGNGVQRKLTDLKIKHHQGLKALLTLILNIALQPLHTWPCKLPNKIAFALVSYYSKIFELSSETWAKNEELGN